MPEILLGNIRGEKGDTGYVTVNGISADAKGNITLTANNLGVKSIAEGTSININDDLDTYLTAGNYVCRAIATATTLVNCPIAEAFVMTVGYANGTSSYIYQELTHFSNGTKYFRMYEVQKQAWNAWKATYTTFNKPTPTEIGAAPAYSYGTSDLTAGTSKLETGKLYFVYE